MILISALLSTNTYGSDLLVKHACPECGAMKGSGEARSTLLCRSCGVRFGIRDKVLA